MEIDQLFEYTQSQFDRALPFVIYRKPEQTQVTAMLQDDEHLYEVSDYMEQGFVFAPFDQESLQTVLIPSGRSRSFFSDLKQELPYRQEKSLKGAVVSLSSDRALHLALVQKGIDVIHKSALKKVVLSRKQTIPQNSISPLDYFKRLAQKYPTAFVYCWYHPKVGLWLGATPETLLSVRNQKLHTMSLAGTQKVTASKVIKWGAKEIEEQQFVTDSIVNNLSGLVNDLDVSEVQTHKAGSLLHLKTEISATISTATSNLGAIIDALHPTPAVCGLPRTMGKDFILNNEGYKRSYYTGFLGELNLHVTTTRARTRRNVENLAYSSVKKQTHLFVNLRCMEIDARGAQLYVGGGITASSDPEAEWEETVHKLQTIGAVLIS